MELHVNIVAADPSILHPLRTAIDQTPNAGSKEDVTPVAFPGWLLYMDKAKKEVSVVYPRRGRVLTLINYDRCAGVNEKENIFGEEEREEEDHDPSRPHSRGWRGAALMAHQLLADRFTKQGSDKTIRQPQFLTTVVDERPRVPPPPPPRPSSIGKACLGEATASLKQLCALKDNHAGITPKTNSFRFTVSST